MRVVLEGARGAMLMLLHRRHTHIIFAELQREECWKGDPCKNVLFGQMTSNKSIQVGTDA